MNRPRWLLHLDISSFCTALLLAEQELLPCFRASLSWTGCASRCLQVVDDWIRIGRIHSMSASVWVTACVCASRTGQLLAGTAR